MILTVLDYASVLVFALTGALAASRAQLDIVGFAFLASLTYKLPYLMILLRKRFPIRFHHIPLHHPRQ